MSSLTRRRGPIGGAASCTRAKTAMQLDVFDDGWYIVSIRGSHRQLKHPTKPGRVTVHGKSSGTVAPGTLDSILKQSGLKK